MGVGVGSALAHPALWRHGKRGAGDWHETCGGDGGYHLSKSASAAGFFVLDAQPSETTKYSQCPDGETYLSYTSLARPFEQFPERALKCPNEIPVRVTVRNFKSRNLFKHCDNVFQSKKHCSRCEDKKHARLSCSKDELRML